MSDITSTAPEPEEPEEEGAQSAEAKPAASFGGGGPTLGKYLSGLGFSVRDMEAETNKRLTRFEGLGRMLYEKPTAPDQDKPAEQMYGMQLIKAMSKEEMIAELMHHFRLQCEDLDTQQLIHNIVHARLQSYSQRLHKEARDAGYGRGSIFE